MNKSIIVTFILSLLILTNCNYGPKFSKGTIEQSDKCVLKVKPKVFFETTVSIEYPVTGLDEQVKKNITETLISELFNKKYSGDINSSMSIVSITNEYVQESLDTSKKKFAPLLETWELESSFYSNIKAGFKEPFKHFLSYSIYREMDEGGAHPIGTEKCITFNTKTGEILKETELFTVDYKEELGKILSANLKESFSDTEKYESLFVKDLVPNSNFYVDKNGVTYVYDTYEIGPYYLGRIYVSIPWQELRTIINEDYL